MRLPARRTAVGDRRGLLVQRRRRALRPGAQPDLARGAGGVPDAAARLELTGRLTASRGVPPPRRPGSANRRPAGPSASATRRRTVRRLSPSVRAICSSLAPRAIWSSSSRRALRAPRRLPPPSPGTTRARLPQALEQQAQDPITSAGCRITRTTSSARSERLGISAAWLPTSASRPGTSPRTRTCSPASAPGPDRPRGPPRAPARGRSPATTGLRRAGRPPSRRPPAPRRSATGPDAASAGRRWRPEGQRLQLGDDVAWLRIDWDLHRLAARAPATVLCLQGRQQPAHGRELLALRLEPLVLVADQTGERPLRAARAHQVVAGPSAPARARRSASTGSASSCGLRPTSSGQLARRAAGSPAAAPGRGRSCVLARTRAPQRRRRPPASGAAASWQFSANVTEQVTSARTIAGNVFPEADRDFHVRGNLEVPGRPPRRSAGIAAGDDSGASPLTPALAGCNAGLWTLDTGTPLANRPQLVHSRRTTAASAGRRSPNRCSRRGGTPSASRLMRPAPLLAEHLAPDRPGSTP